jgi:hypothetical protein
MALSASNAAADAKATGNALAGKLSTNGGTINGNLTIQNGTQPELVVKGSKPEVRIVSGNTYAGLLIKDGTCRIKTNSHDFQLPSRDGVLALAGDIPTTMPWGDITGKPPAFAPSKHKLTHSANGSDAISPNDIGAAPLVSPTFIGTPLAPDINKNTVSQIATKNYVDSSIEAASGGQTAGANMFLFTTPTVNNGSF